MTTYKGKFKCKNPAKYKGDSTNIIYRSGLELKLMSYFDRHKDVVYWQSEEISIPYRSPIDNRVHRYFPDMLAKIKRADNSIRTILVEVKPLKQTRAPIQQDKKNKRYIKECVTYATNIAKFKAADAYCKDHGWEFRIITEQDINGRR